MGDSRAVTYEIRVQRIDGAPLRQGTRCVVEISRNGKVKATTHSSDPFQSGKPIQWSQKPAVLVFQSQVHPFTKSATGFKKKEFTIKVRAVDRDGNLVTLGKELLDFGRFTSRDGSPVQREADLSVRLRGTVQMPVLRLDLRSQQGLQQGRNDDWLQDEPREARGRSTSLPTVEEEAQAFAQWFQEADIDRDGEASGEEAAFFFERSGLDRDILFQIWQIADPVERGWLDRRSFDFALRLLSFAQQGVRNLSDPSVLAKAKVPASVRLPHFRPSDQEYGKHETSSVASDSASIPQGGGSSFAIGEDPGIAQLNSLDLFADFYAADAPGSAPANPQFPQEDASAASHPAAAAGDQVLSFVQGSGNAQPSFGEAIPPPPSIASRPTFSPFPTQVQDDGAQPSEEFGFEDNFADMLQVADKSQTLHARPAAEERQDEDQPILLESSRVANGQYGSQSTEHELQVSVEEFEAMKEELQAALEALEAERYDREQLVEELQGKDDGKIAALQAEIEKLRASSYTNEEAVTEARNEKMRRMRAERELAEMKVAWNEEQDELRSEIERLEEELSSYRRSATPVPASSEEMP